MSKKSGVYLFFFSMLLTQAGCASDGLTNKKVNLSSNHHLELKCKTLKTNVGMANHQVKIVEREAHEKLGNRFNKTERSLGKHPDLLNTYSISLDNLAQAVQNYKSQPCH
ncbi:MAG: hypothetical protein Q8K37_00740 [Alphaproteobacteria bacterium]|nr:hypothetical protein [Alphaproteobacteria bacterium]